jgi:hydrogenase maturation protease
MKKTLVIGIGSALRCDDGVGIQIVEELRKENLPKEIRLECADVSGPDLIKYFPGFEKVVIIDAADMNKKPGAVRIFNEKKLRKGDFKESVSTHGISLIETLKIAEKIDIKPEIIVFGIQPFDISFKAGLSEALQKKVPVISAMLKEVLTK